MDDIDKILRKYHEHAERISADESEQEYVVQGFKDIPVQVPYSYLADAQGRCNVLERLLRKDVPGSTILAFIERAKKDGRWG